MADEEDKLDFEIREGEKPMVAYIRAMSEIGYPETATMCLTQLPLGIIVVISLQLRILSNMMATEGATEETNPEDAKRTRNTGLLLQDIADKLDTLAETAFLALEARKHIIVDPRSRAPWKN